MDSKIIEVLVKENMKLSYVIENYLKIDSPIYDELKAYINNISFETLDDELAKDINWIYRDEKDLFKQKTGVAINLIQEEIDVYRFKYLVDISGVPEPYLANDELIDFDEDYLIDCKENDIRDGALFSNEECYFLMPSIQSKHSMYWCYELIYELKKYSKVSVRLDPFMRVHKKDFRPMMFKAYVFGRELDWERISRVKTFEDVQWMPDDYPFSSNCKTDAVWTRRNDGIHFICEEIPSVDKQSVRGSRYFHSIYDPEKEVIIHADAAIRIFNENELDERIKTHVRKTGKIGKRIKLMKADGEIPKELWVRFVMAFFYWNNDVQNYFREPKESNKSK